jgi:hypothetical protein
MTSRPDEKKQAARLRRKGKAVLAARTRKRKQQADLTLRPEKGK